MKKLIPVILCLMLAVVCLCGCSKDLYKKMDEIVRSDFAQVDIEIVTVNGSDTLTSTLSVKNQGSKSTVNYSVQQFSKLSADSLPDSYITTANGVVEVENGAIVSQTGDAVQGLNFAKTINIQYVFNKGYFANAEFLDGVFRADVVNAKNFVGDNNLNCSDMKVVFDYASAQKSLTVTYTDSNGVVVQLNYKMK